MDKERLKEALDLLTLSRDVCADLNCETCKKRGKK
jgi:hypothetical protein